jgi:pSer/pThr/pTyr-binding forkhead associated (FHA) protein
MADGRPGDHRRACRRVVRVDTPVFTIGRRSKSDLCLAGTDVSRDYAQIACDGGRFILRDRKSRYGTFVNDQPDDVTALVLRYTGT